jgi:hypothetical protein
LIGPDNGARGIHHSDAIAVPIECHSNVSAPGTDGCLQLAEIFRHRRIGVVRWKSPIDRRIQQRMAPGQPGGECADNSADRPISAIPDNVQSGRALAHHGQPIDIRLCRVGAFKFELADGATCSRERLRRDELPQSLPEHRLTPKEQLESIMVRWIMGACDHDATIEVTGVHGKMQLGSRADPEALHLHATANEAVDKRILQLGGTQPTVAADSNAALALPERDGRISEAESIRIVQTELPPDAPPYIVGAHGGPVYTR